MAGWLGREGGRGFSYNPSFSGSPQQHGEIQKQLKKEEEEEEATKSDTNKKRRLTNRVPSTVLIFFFQLFVLRLKKEYCIYERKKRKGKNLFILHLSTNGKPIFQWQQQRQPEIIESTARKSRSRMGGRATQDEKLKKAKDGGDKIAYFFEISGGKNCALN